MTTVATLETHTDNSAPRNPIRLYAAGRQGGYSKKTVDQLKLLLSATDWVTTERLRYELACELVALAKVVGWDSMYRRATDAISYLSARNNFNAAGITALIKKVKEATDFEKTLAAEAHPKHV